MRRHPPDTSISRQHRRRPSFHCGVAGEACRGVAGEACRGIAASPEKHGVAALMLQPSSLLHLPHPCSLASVAPPSAAAAAGEA
jgi:hypothetical protein